MLRLRLFISFVHGLDLHFRHYILPVFYSLISSVFEGLTFWLLMSVVEGLFDQHNFKSFWDNLDQKIPFKSWHIIFPGNLRVFLFLLGLIALSVVFKNIFVYLSMTRTAFNVRKFSNVLRKKIYQRYLSFGKLFFDKRNPGYLQQVLIGNTSQMANELTQFSSMLGMIFNVAVYLVIMFHIKPELTLCILLFFPVLHFAVQAIIKRIRLSSEDYAQYYADLGKKISNALQCIPLIKTYSSEEKEKEWFDYSSDRVQKYEYAVDQKRSIITPLQDTIMLFGILLILALLASFLIPKPTLLSPHLIVFFLVLRRAMVSFGVFNQFITSIASISGPMGQIKAVLDDRDKYFIKDGKKIFTGHQHNIVFENISFRYPSEDDPRYVLDNINLTARKGEMLAIVGTSGAGKSTLISLLLRFYDPTYGRILIDGEDIRDYTLESLHDHMALVSQETYLFSAPLKVNLTYGLKIEPSTDEIGQALQQARLEDFVSSLPQGLETEIGDRGINLSGGERQRLAMARALLRKSEILILDEATSALDSTTETMIQSSLRKLIAGRTCIVIAHRLSTIRHANQIIVLEQGRIIEQGNIDQLLEQKGKFHEFWEKQRFF